MPTQTRAVTTRIRMLPRKTTMPHGKKAALRNQHLNVLRERPSGKLKRCCFSIAFLSKMSKK